MPGSSSNSSSPVWAKSRGSCSCCLLTVSCLARLAQHQQQGEKQQCGGHVLLV